MFTVLADDSRLISRAAGEVRLLFQLGLLNYI